jgi:hypothetical protein
MTNNPQTPDLTIALVLRLLNRFEVELAEWHLPANRYLSSDVSRALIRKV